ncbi:DUF805 domain-containing protein [Candidatus Gracilibacteria bacterium]|nr:DUF805 domain-containing protein [Candidatus Gracilibacteria bacterium]MBS9783761.1 DUF805 domain-containing protein [Candidatus Gracilibacteria bacterium]
MKIFDTTISYKEKYWLFGKENRIRRVLFFYRMLCIPILIGLIMILLGGGLSYTSVVAKANVTSVMIMSLIMYSLLLLFEIFLVPKIVRKRMHDMGKENRKIEYLVILFPVFREVVNIIMLILFMIDPKMVFSFLIGGASDVLYYILLVFQIISGLFVLYLLFAPGTQGPNDYGEDRYYKPGLLG